MTGGGNVSPRQSLLGRSVVEEEEFNLVVIGAGARGDDRT